MTNSVPSTPKAARAKTINTPRLTRKKTVLESFEQSYIEEDDRTYVYNETIEIDDDDDDDYSEEGETVNIMDELQEDVDEETDVELEVVTDKETEEVPEPNVDEIIIGPSDDLTKFRNFLVKHEVVRKLLHSSIGVGSLYLYTLGYHQTQIVMPLVVLFTIIFTNDLVRFNNPEFNKFIVDKFFYITRQSEVNLFNGTLYFIVGLILVLSVLPKDISLMSILLLSWADTAASTFGRLYGKYTFKIAEGKSFAGALASFAAGVLSCYVLYGYFIPEFGAKVNTPEDILWTASTSKLSLPVYALVCGVVASVSELVSLFGIDDNFTIPVLGGYILYGVVKALMV